MTKYIDLAHDITGVWDSTNNCFFQWTLTRRFTKHLKRLSFQASGKIQKAVHLIPHALCTNYFFWSSITCSLGNPLSISIYIKVLYIQ